MGSVVGFLEVGENLVEGFLARLLVVVAGLGDGVALVVGLLADLLAQFLVVDLMAVFALNVGAEFFRQFYLQFAHGLDGIHSGFEGTDHILLGYFLHLAFHHHDVLGGGTDHDVHVGFFHLLEGRVDDVLAIDAGYANF